MPAITPMRGKDEHLHTSTHTTTGMNSETVRGTVLHEYNMFALQVIDLMLLVGWGGWAFGKGGVGP